MALPHNETMMTIGALASRAGVTVRAVRHYHAKGLLAEPDRDDAGYRRYDATAVVELIKIRTLAEAGIPLARVRELLHANAEEFAVAIADVDERLREEIRVRQRHRKRIARLAAGDALVLPREVVDFLDELRALGVDERIVAVERDGWIPLALHAPATVRELLQRKRSQLVQPPLVAFYLTLGRAIDQPCSDALLVELADETACYLDELTDARGVDYVAGNLEPSVVQLLDDLAVAAAPVTGRLRQLMAERGWSGWTRLERG